MADKKEVTTTDDQGAYTFPDLADGVWSIKVEILGFQTATRDIGVAFDAPPADWDLKLMTAADLADALKPKEAPAPAVASAPTPAAPTAAGAPAAATAVATPAPTAPAASTTPAATQQASNANGGRGGTNQAGRSGRNQTTAATGRGGTQNNAAAGRGATQANGRPSLVAAAGGFQEVGVSQSAETSAFSQEGNLSADATAELSQSANQAYVIQGSQSTAMGMGGQADFGDFGGRGGGMGGFGGPGMGGMGGDAAGGMGGGIPGMGGDAAGGAAGVAGMGGGGRGGAGGAGGGPGMGGGRGGGGGGFGGPGGGGMGGGRGGGGMGFAGGGRGGPGGRGMNQAGARAFGNNRRNPRMMYTGSLNINEANSLLNAQGYSIIGINLGKPYSNRTNTTGSVGGPFKIPKLLDGTKGQFQLNFTVSRSRSGGQSSLTTMPNALERQGNFNGVLGSTSAAFPNGAPVVVYDPTTCQASGCIPYPNDTVPVSQMSQQLLKFYSYPNINLTAFKNNYQKPTTPLNNVNSINSRVNQTLNAKNRMMVSFAYQGSNSTTPNPYAFLDPNTGNPIVDTGSVRNMNASGTWSHNFSTRLINSLVYTFSRARTLQSPYFSGLTNIEGNLGIQGVATDPLNWGPPSLSFTNFGGLSDRTASLVRNQTSSLTESLMWVHQKHTFTFGGGYRRQQWNTQNNSLPRGSFGFNGDATSNYINGVPVAGTGFDLADFLIGVPDTARVQCAGGGATNLCNGDPSYYFRGAVTSLYVTDDWRLFPRFSLSLGARWDYQTPVYELNNQIVNMAFAPNFTAYAPVVPGQTNPYTNLAAPSALVNPDKGNVSPRFGFAWRPSAKKSTRVSGGYGVSYNTSAYSSMAMSLSQQPPQARSLNLNILNNLPLLQTNGITMANALNLAANTGTSLSKNTYAIDPNYKIGYAQTWNLSIQQNLPFSFQTTATYTGVKGTDLDRQMHPWVSPPGCNLVPTCNATLPASLSAYPPGYTYETYGGNSSANVASIQMMRRFSGGISVNTSYTFTKYLAESNSIMDWQNARLDRYAQTGPQRLNISAQYSTGQGRLGAGLLTGWKGHLVKDWTIQTSISLSSGNPLTPSCGGNNCLAWGSNGLSSRPEYTGAPLAPVLPGQYFNPGAFALPTPGVWGSAALGSIAGPLGYSLNGSASRVFRFGDRHSMDLQLQSTNVLNTVIINGYNTSVGSLTEGQATNVSGMRTVTASLRFRF